MEIHTDILLQVDKANEQVLKDKEHLAEQLAQTEAARAKLRESELELQKQLETLRKYESTGDERELGYLHILLLARYLEIVKQQGLLPEAAHFRGLLKAVVCNFL